MFFEYLVPAAGFAFATVAIIWLITTAGSQENGARNSTALWVLLGFLTVTVSYWGISGYLLFDIDEAIFAEAAREMVKTGDYITPSYNFAPRYDKPILIYWLMSISYKLFGVSEFSARFTSAFSGTLLVLFTFGFVKRVRGTLPALFASLALLLNIGFFVYTHAAVTDITLCLLIGSSVYAFYLGVHTKKERWVYCAWIASALALLLKGLIGLFIPSAIALLYLLLSRNLWEVKRFIRLRYILLFLLIAAPWHVAEFYVKGWEFFDSYVMKHQVMRYTSGFSGKSGPFYYYIPIIALSFFPWAAFIPVGLKRGFDELRAGGGGLYLLSSIWFVFIFAFFSYAATKHPNYTLPLLPAVAIMAGCVAGEYAKRLHGLRRRARRGSAIYIHLILSILFGVTLIALPSFNVKMDITLSDWFFYALGALFLLNGVYAASAWSKPANSVAGMAVITFAMLLLLRSTLIPAASDSLQKTLFEYGMYVRTLNIPHVVTYEIHKPSLAFYGERKVQRLSKVEFEEFIKTVGTEPVLLITSEKRYKEFERAKDFKIIDRRGGYILISNSKRALAPVPESNAM